MTTMRLGIIGAMESEVQYIREQLQDAQTERIAGMDFSAGLLGDTDVVVVKCGIGKVNAAVCAHTLIYHFGVTHIINTGVAGALDASINIGDIVVSTDAVHHDFNVTPLGYAPGQIPSMDVLSFKADDTLRQKTIAVAQKVAPEVTVREGRVASGEQFVASAAEKGRIVSTFNALCCEMEGSAIAQVCYLFGTPFVIARAISDKADGSSAVDYPTFEVEAANRCAQIVTELAQVL